MDPQQTEHTFESAGVPPMCIRTGIDGTQDVYVEKSGELQAVIDFQRQHPHYETHPNFDTVLRPYIIWSQKRRQQQQQANSSGTIIWHNWFAPEMPYRNITADTVIPDLAISLGKRQLTALRIDPFRQSAVRVAVPIDILDTTSAVSMLPQNKALRVLLGLDIMSRTHGRPYESASHSEGQLQIYYAWSSSRIKQGDARIPGWCLPSSSFNAMRHMLGVALVFQREVVKLQPNGNKIDLLHDCSQSCGDAFVTGLQYLPVLGEKAYGHKTLTVKCTACQRDQVTACSSCHLAMYCSADCQRRDWPQHKPECIALKKALKLKLRLLV